jgi:hypothetical protein
MNKDEVGRDEVVKIVVAGKVDFDAESVVEVVVDLMVEGRGREVETRRMVEGLGEAVVEVSCSMLPIDGVACHSFSSCMFKNNDENIST